MATQKNVKSAPEVDTGAVDYDSWTEEQIGFAPYWKPGVGKFFVGAPLAVDMRDPEFVRYQFIAYEDLECQRGPANEEDPNAEKVTVKKGETFSVSVYHALRDAFDTYLNFSASQGKAVPVRVDALKTVKTANQPKCWQFRARVEPNVMKAVQAWKAETRQFIAASAVADKTLPASV